MKIFSSKSDVTEILSSKKKEGKTIGFVPTMGALHKGHLSLVEVASATAEVVVCSIFVNPTQFTNQEDLERYPRPLEADINIVEKSGCDFLFIPSVEEMYSTNEQWVLDLGYLENILEGKFRKGHYQGVTQIVKKLLDVVQPDYMFLGQKDFQQVMILDQMVKLLSLPVTLVMCPIIREEDGLALSSRNVHLSHEERGKALVLSKALLETKMSFLEKSIDELKNNAEKLLEMSTGVDLEYFEIVDSSTLLPVTSKDANGIVALIAAKVGNTRLIDNIILK